MPVSNKSMPGALAGSRRHLFDLVTDTDYRNRKSNASYDFVPRSDGGPGTPGSGGKKWGYDANLPAGIAQAHGRADPGRYRFYRHIPAGRAEKASWWVLEHTPGNTYKFIKISIPRCEPCKGTAETLCATCKGVGRVTEGRYSGPCSACGGRANAVSACSSCCPNPIIVDGYSIEKNFIKW